MAKKVTRRQVIEELAKVEQQLVTLEEQRGDPIRLLDEVRAAQLDSQIAAAERGRDSLIRQVTMTDQAKFNKWQVQINWLLLAATAASALFAGLGYFRPRNLNFSTQQVSTGPAVPSPAPAQAATVAPRPSPSAPSLPKAR